MRAPSGGMTEGVARWDDNWRPHRRMCYGTSHAPAAASARQVGVLATSSPRILEVKDSARRARSSVGNARLAAQSQPPSPPHLG